MAPRPPCNFGRFVNAVAAKIGSWLGEGNVNRSSRLGRGMQQREASIVRHLVFLCCAFFRFRPENDMAVLRRIPDIEIRNAAS
ncbi:hypothetical protein ABID19_004356 [Mesorhizobium robiniae]|uniref:Transposase n=1 Tax=Mesorhizobium robiniae TaxID=559315 RepID=A0ABV2GSP3_9HYPH